MDRHTLLSVKGLEIGYGKNKIIGDIKFELHSGEIAAVMGPNGVGKSTLLRALSGLLPPISGQVLLDNRDI